MPRTAASVVSRRSALAGAVGLAVGAGLAGCTSTPKKSVPPGPTSEPRPGADETARRAAAALEEHLALLAGFVATGLSPAERALAALGAAARTLHTAHAAAMLEGLPAPRASKTPASTAGPTVSSSPSPSQLGTAQANARVLIQAQTDAAGSHQRALDGVSGPLARLLASVAAADLAEAAVLRAEASR